MYMIPEKPANPNSKRGNKGCMGRPKGNGEKPKYVNITMSQDAMEALGRHSHPSKYLDSLLCRECDQTITRIQVKGCTLLNMLSVPAAVCAIASASLYILRP